MIRSPLRQCGRQYADEAEALRSKAGQRPGVLVELCWAGGHFHITTPRITASRAGEFPAAESRARNAATRKAGSGSGRHESFSPAVAALIDARDPWCIHCGSPRDLQRHHRRIKGIGGDPRPHTDCSCVGVRICLTCHDRAHSGKGRREAEAEGLIIPRSTVEPWTLSVLVHLEEDRGGLNLWPLCDGTWGYAPPAGLIAAIAPDDAAELVPSLRARGGQ